MFFIESARIAERHPHLARAFELLDSQLGKLGPADVVRPDDLASFLRIDPNQIRSALEMFAQEGVLNQAEMIECSYCQMAAARSDYQEALDDEVEYRCTSCDRPLTDRTARIITAYRRGEKWQDTQSSAPGAGLDEQTRNAERACVFCRSGKVWTLSFEGTTVHVANLVGMGYIAELLRHARSPIEADTLVATVGENTETPTQSVEGRVVVAGAAMPGIPLTDTKAIKAVEAELKKRQGDLKDTSADDGATTSRLEREISQLQEYLAQVKGHHGRSRTTGGFGARARTRAKHAIDRAITRIAEQHLSLANHLQNSIQTGNSLVYMPTEVPDWRF